SSDSGHEQPLAPAAKPTQELMTVPAINAVQMAAPEPLPSPTPTPTTEPTPKVVDTTPRVGSSGPVVLELEQKLSNLGYMVGKVDGKFDNATRHGVIAFQKIEGLRRSGKGDDSTRAKLSGAATPGPRFSTPPDHLEVDIPRQVVFVVRGGRVTAILPTSTGSNKSFTSEGWTRKAITPNGQFRITRKINGMRISPLGELYKPSYFNGGIAFHGNPSVPTYAASHGCVRLPMPFADWFFANASPVGMVVYVYGGPAGANPQPFIDDKPAEKPLPSPEPEEAVPDATPTPPAPPPVATPSPTAEEVPSEEEQMPQFPFPFDPEVGFDD
ncbi:MAG: L,D-transpeptidase family protein, partial [Actinomycetota bacterium]|nr:L,D-transpeptidase family protein [Actinomycetota bacterium]